MSLFSLLIPAATVNLVENPSFETNTTCWGGWVGGAITRVSATSRRGSYGLQVTPASDDLSGMYYSVGLDVTAGQTYVLSFDFWGAVGVTYYALFDYDVLQPVAIVTIIGDGAWHRYTGVITNAAHIKNGNLFYFVKAGNSVAPFYLDGVQFEALAYATTYVDGSLALTTVEQQAGFLASGVAWTGTAHASTSTRTATSRRGGVWTDLGTLGLYVETALGLGTPPVKTTRTELANPKAPGSLFEHAHEAERVITLSGTLMGTSLADLEAVRAALKSAMAVNQNGTSGDDEPFMLRYAGRAVTQEIACHYEGGLEGVAMDGFSERVAVRLIADYPYWTASIL
jgi:hypothetical protein